jgi:hypothetical protein
MSGLVAFPSTKIVGEPPELRISASRADAAAQQRNNAGRHAITAATVHALRLESSKCCFMIAPLFPEMAGRVK